MAGQRIANPIGAILSVGMLLEYGLGRPDLARSVERAVFEALRVVRMRPRRMAHE